VAFIVNSSPGAGLRFEASVTLPNAKAAISHAATLAQRGMRLIKIRDTESGEIFDERGLRDKLLQAARDERVRGAGADND
jgi:hypothetical protein